MVRTTFSCANATCGENTRDLRKNNWQKRPAVFQNAKTETESTTHICRECYNTSLQLRHEAESRRATRTSPDAAMQPVRHRSASAPEVVQLAACDGLSSSGDEEEEEVEEVSTTEIEMGLAESEHSEVSFAANEEEEEEEHMQETEAGTGGDTLDQYIRIYEEQHGLRKPHRQQGAVFLRENPVAARAALKCVRELLRRLYLLERKTKLYLAAEAALQQSKLPPLLSLFSVAIRDGAVPADHAVWSELADTFQNMYATYFLAELSSHRLVLIFNFCF